jgi:hypothetical protein
VGKLGCIESVQVAEQEQRPLVGVEMPFEKITECDYFLGVPLRLLAGPREAGERSDGAPPPAQRAQGAVPGDRKDPGLRARGGRKLRSSAKCVVEGVLKQILREAAIPNHLHKEPSDRVLTASEQRFGR